LRAKLLREKETQEAQEEKIFYFDFASLASLGFSFNRRNAPQIHFLLKK